MADDGRQLLFCLPRRSFSEAGSSVFRLLPARHSPLGEVGSSGLLRLFGFHLIISAKEFLSDAKPFDMRMLSCYHYERFILSKVERVEESDKSTREDT